MRPRQSVFLCLMAVALAAASLIGFAQAPQSAQTQTAQTQTTQLRLVSTAWPPFTNGPGHPRFALDLVEAGLRRAGITASTTIVEPPRYGTAMLSQEFDGSGAAWKDEARARVLLFSQPYLENRLVIIGRKGADVSATTFAALKGKRIAIVEGYAYGDIDNAGPTFVRTTDEQDSLTRLLASEVDYALMDELVVQYIVKNHPTEAQSKLQLGSMPLLKRQLHLAVRKSLPDAESIINRFNAQLRDMIADRTYHHLLHVSWIEADVDGDGVPELVPETDAVGTAPPDQAYSLFTERPSNGPVIPDMSKPGYYVGGTIYPDWATVPANYKQYDVTRAPDSSAAAASVFKFVWK